MSTLDSLPNKEDELMALVNNAPYKPELIALREIKF